MLSDDARWFASLVTSMAQEDAPESGGTMWAILHHGCRIQFEGRIVLSSKRLDVSRPDLLARWDKANWGPVERMRHFSKMLDNKGRSIDALLKSINETYLASRNELAESYPRGQRWKRWLTGDISVLTLNGHLMGSSVIAMERYGVRWGPGEAASAAVFRGAAESWGRNVATLCGVDGGGLRLTHEDLSPIKIREVDKNAKSYFARRYGASTPLPEAFLISMIEGDINSSRFVIGRGSEQHWGAMFRAQFITLYHALRALRDLREAKGSRVLEGNPKLSAAIESEAALVILSDAGRRLRNRFVHYEISDPQLSVDPSLPMFGLLDSLGVGWSYDEARWHTQCLTRDISQALGG